MGILERVGTPNYSLKMTQSSCPDKESPFQIFCLKIRRDSRIQKIFAERSRTKFLRDRFEIQILITLAKKN
ncbi:hypothetical protein A0128_16405 [Leptospira tipperaryensis]|uniref:Uncharacterized protein n=1 Tax=Leptospira tipperaryensis TaxID=2564040 RepID=A0A1D7V0C1_9LEPT|nr:hypothetical protein A0128_16405 [Leptospira tipperaryensis]